MTPPTSEGLARVGEGEIRATGLWRSAVLSQVPLLAEDLERGGHLYPQGRLDQDLQQVDLRDFNSWRMTLAEVPTAELLEVHLVNAVAPFIWNARLRPLLAAVPTDDAHVVNVSAMEGQFYRRWKTDKHPHTNMAKAALNMMTRTSAVDYVRDGIHMNSVDTGWVTDEDPVALAAAKVAVHDFSPPLDIIDGAARIVDPLFDGISTGRHVWGLFLKDYKPAPGDLSGPAAGGGWLHLDDLAAPLFVSRHAERECAPGAPMQAGHATGARLQVGRAVDRCNRAGGLLVCRACTARSASWSWPSCGGRRLEQWRGGYVG